MSKYAGVLKDAAGNELYPVSSDYYMPGDSVIARNVYVGFTQNSSGSIQCYFTVALDKPIHETVTAAKLSGSMTVRANGATQTVTLTNFAANGITSASGLTFAYTGLGSLSAGHPAAVWLGSGSTITFS